MGSILGTLLDDPGARWIRSQKFGVTFIEHQAASPHLSPTRIPFSKLRHMWVPVIKGKSQPNSNPSRSACLLFQSCSADELSFLPTVICSNLSSFWKRGKALEGSQSNGGSETGSADFPFCADCTGQFSWALVFECGGGSARLTLFKNCLCT